MIEMDVIKPVSEPTQWCSGMVVVPKQNGKVRICVDLKPLNEAVIRERYTLPLFEDITARLAGSSVYSILDASSGYWQLALQEDSQLLTTFITPFGRYAFKRVPFGITSASEIYQRKMAEMLEGIDGVAVYQDDILVYGKNLHEHNKILSKVTEMIKASGLKLNEAKCQIGVHELRYLGHVISKDGVKPDYEKVKAIAEMEAPKNITELRTTLGLLQYLCRFVPNFSTIGEPLYALLKQNRAWLWGPEQDKSFKTIKLMITKAPILSFYDVECETRVCADSSSYGLGAMLQQR